MRDDRMVLRRGRVPPGCPGKPECLPVIVKKSMTGKVTIALHDLFVQRFSIYGIASLLRIMKKPEISLPDRYEITVREQTKQWMDTNMDA